MRIRRRNSAAMEPRRFDGVKVRAVVAGVAVAGAAMEPRRFDGVKQVRNALSPPTRRPQWSPAGLTG
jgi:hypothetical protein